MLIIVLVVLLTWYVFFSLRNWTLPLQRLEESSHEFVHVNVKSSHAVCRKSSLTSKCFFFSLGVKILGRNFAAMQCKFKFDVKIPWTHSNKSLPPFQFWHTFCSTSLTFSGIAAMEGYPDCMSSSCEVQPLLKWEYHSKHFTRLIDSQL